MYQVETWCVYKYLLCNVIYDATVSFSLQLLPDSVDPMELLSYLDPPDLNTPPSSGASSNNSGGATTNDDILALFE